LVVNAVRADRWPGGARLATRPPDTSGGGKVPDVLLPKWGISMTEATVVHWHQLAGADVVAGQPLVDVETDKVETTLDAPASGRLEIRVEVGQTAPVGSVLAVIE
jgi:pyruvate/2-oxoglutarate dehydrogenase complex dihydrolipoamide acyltransferase (E2) component